MKVNINYIVKENKTGLLMHLFYISGFIIVWAMIEYSLSLKLMGKLCKKLEELKIDNPELLHPFAVVGSAVNILSGVV